MIHPHTELRHISTDVGSGVFATAFIPKGTIVWTQCHLDIVMSPAKVAALPAVSRTIAEIYGYGLSNGDTVLCWDNGRFVNHSCDPAMMSVDSVSEIAVRDIHAGEELTCDYAVLNYAHTLSCLCGAKSCRSNISHATGQMTEQQFYAPLRAAMQIAKEVSQPLRDFALDPDAFDRSLLMADPLPMESHLRGRLAA